MPSDALGPSVSEGIASPIQSYAAVCTADPLDALEIYEYPAYSNLIDPVNVRTPDTYQASHKLA
jgi:hypothetical protein